MEKEIKKVAVLGSGVMGSAIGAHFTNVGIPCLLLDIPAKEGEKANAIVDKNFKAIQKAKPAAFYAKKNARLVSTGNFDADLDQLKDCDLIIEVIVERMDIKQQLLQKIDKVRANNAIVATNTSGLSVNEMSKHCSEGFKKHFLGMHFFNPPRYLKLLEIIPTPATDPAVVEFACRFGEDVLGKGIVMCKDTPNFIANRIGSYIISHSIHTMEKEKYTIQEVDGFTGTNIGHPKSATFRTADIVGLDVLTHVSGNLYDGLAEDDEKEVFRTPEFIQDMVKKGMLGAKTKKGFYQKSPEGEIQHLDYTSGQYAKKEKLQFKSIAAARKVDDLDQKFAAMVNAGDRGSDFLWRIYADAFLYSLKRIGEICDSIVDIDNAMKWGWGHQQGPFEKMDTLGVAPVVERLKKEGKSIPPILEEFLSAGNTAFYKREKGVRSYYDFASKSYKEIAPNERVIILKDLKDQSKVIFENAGASLIDLGDEVACLEFHSKMNAVGPDIVSMAIRSVQEVEKNYRGLVIGNQDPRAFSAGANIMLLLMSIMEEEWDEIDLIIRNFQKMNMGFRYSAKPVVAAAHGLALGGGCEVLLHADKVVASAESYIGLVEVGAGLIPAGGGSKEMLLRAVGGLPADAVMLPFLRKVFESLGMAKVATSAEEAREMGFLQPHDQVVVNGDYVLRYAKETVLGLEKAGYRKPVPRSDIPVMGREGLAAVKMLLQGMQEGGHISEHDAIIGMKLGHILTGGDLTGPHTVDEKYLLELERESFLSLCGMRKSQERIKHILETGKPLRN